MMPFLQFLFCFLSFLVVPHCTPELRPIFFAPYLVAHFYRAGRKTILVHAFLVGILSDIGSSYLFGIHALLYVIVSAGLYRTRKIFLKDKWSSLPLINVFFSLAFIYLSYPVLAIFNHRVTCNGANLVLDMKHALLIDFTYSFLIYLFSYTCSHVILRGRPSHTPS